MGKQTFDRIKKTLHILLLVFFVMSITVGAVSARGGDGPRGHPGDHHDNHWKWDGHHMWWWDDNNHWRWDGQYWRTINTTGDGMANTGGTVIITGGTARTGGENTVLIREFSINLNFWSVISKNI